MLTRSIFIRKLLKMGDFQPKILYFWKIIFRRTKIWSSRRIMSCDVVFIVCVSLWLPDRPMTLAADYEQQQRSHAYMTPSSTSWYGGHDVRRPPVVTWSGVEEVTSSYGSSACSSHPMAVDYSAATSDANTSLGWSLVDLKPCITPCGLSAYTGQPLKNSPLPVVVVQESGDGRNIFLNIDFWTFRAVSHHEV